MKKIILITMLLSLLCSCNIVNENVSNELSTSKPQHSNQVTPQESTALISGHTTESFSYLNQLSSEKQVLLNEFINSKNIQVLSGFTPEEMLLTYFHFITIGNADLMYLITYDNNLLPELSTFKHEYFSELSNQDSEMVMHYRYYDSIKIFEMNEDNTNAVIEISVSIGIITHTASFSLHKEDGIWKVDIYHRIISE